MLHLFADCFWFCWTGHVHAPGAIRDRLNTMKQGVDGHNRAWELTRGVGTLLWVH